jgi:hypothetical protein
VQHAGDGAARLQRRLAAELERVRVRRAVVLGGYGLIGSACMRALAEAGFEVTGIGRSRRSAIAADPAATWVIRDIPTISTEEWRGLLIGVDVVVNASGALQDGAGDDLEAIHVTAVARLVEAAVGTSLRIDGVRPYQGARRCDRFQREGMGHSPPDARVVARSLRRHGTAASRRGAASNPAKGFAGGTGPDRLRW